MYRYYGEIAGATVEALRFGREMEFPMDEILRGLQERPRVLFIANPNNPTGTLLQVPKVEKILGRDEQSCRYRRGLCRLFGRNTRSAHQEISESFYRADVLQGRRASRSASWRGDLLRRVAVLSAARDAALSGESSRARGGAGRHQRWRCYARLCPRNPSHPCVV